MMRLLPLCAVLLFSPVAASAQVGNILNDPEATEALLETLVSVNDAVRENAEEGRLETELDRLRPAIREDLSWSGQNGYLLQIRAFVDANGGVRLLSGPAKCGSAMTPSDALALCLANGVIQQDAPAGLQFSASKSYFVWASKRRPLFGVGQERIDYGVIPGELAGVLWRDTATLLASDRVISEIRQARNREAIDNAVERVRAKMRNSAERALLASTHQKLREQQARVKEIDRKLAETLSQISKANAMTQQLDMLQGVLTVSSTIAAVKAMLPPGTNTASLDNLSSVPAVRGWLTEYGQRLGAEGGAMNLQLQQSQQEAVRANEAVMQFLNRYQAPKDLLY